MMLLLDFVVIIATMMSRLLSPGGYRGLVAENLALRQQLLIVQRKQRRSPNLRKVDRFILGICALFIQPRRIAKIAVILRPATILRFHRALMQRKYRALFTSKSRSKPGPKGPSSELRDAIVAIKRRNPRFGCRRIAMIVARTFGVDIDKDVVRRVLASGYRPKSGSDGPSWLTFLGHTKDSLWSVDLFRCESVSLKSHWVMVILDQCTRRIVGFAVQAEPVDSGDICRLYNEATVHQLIPKKLSTDNDPVFQSHRWQAHLRVVEIEEVKTVPHVPLSHPFVERLIGTIRREFLDHTLFWTATDLRHKLDDFKIYYNEHRSHVALNGATPKDTMTCALPQPANLARYRWRSHCRGLFRMPIAA